MQRFMPRLLLRLLFRKYVARDADSPSTDRILSTSCIVRRKTICPAERARTSLERKGIYLASNERCRAIIYAIWVISESEAIQDEETEPTPWAYSCRITALYSMALVTKSLTSSNTIGGDLTAMRRRAALRHSVGPSPLDEVNSKRTQRNHMFLKSPTNSTVASVCGVMSS